jgi:phosphatidylinositol-3-phosphatase
LKVWKFWRTESLQNWESASNLPTRLSALKVTMSKRYRSGRAVLHLWLFAVATLAIQTTCGGGSTVPPGKGTIPVVGHVFVLVEENHSYDSVIGNSAMPYTNSLAQKYALATQYFADRHNSLPNYFMLTVGDLVTTDDLYAGTVTSDNVVRALTAAGKTWRIYAESVPSPGFTGVANPPYAKDHNPFAYFADVLNSSGQASNIVPVTQLASDIQNNTLPDYAMIVPNLANDGHDCPGEASNCTDTDKLANIDNWVQTNIGPLINSSVFQSSLLIYTWDEGDVNDMANQGGRVATILISPKIRSGFQSTTMYQHQSALKLSMQLLGVSDFPGAAASAPDMAEFF